MEALAPLPVVQRSWRVAALLALGLFAAARTGVGPTLPFHPFSSERVSTTTCPTPRTGTHADQRAEFGSTLRASKAAAEPAISEAWTEEVKERIRKEEYFIHFQPEVGAFQSPNRAQNLRITYSTAGFSLAPRTGGSSACIDLDLESIGKNAERFTPLADARLHADGPSLHVSHGAFSVDYLNDERGMRQNFVLLQKPAGEGPVKVRLRCSGATPVAEGAGDILLVEQGDGTTAPKPLAWYKDLHAWDANGDTLAAIATVHDGLISLEVNDSEAVYPITIDPLSTTANWTKEINQANAFFGFAVSTAGDVNGDGYSDVIIGAPFFDGGQTDEGKAYVYHGSATGPAAAAAWTHEGGIADQAFAWKVSTAGDANGDGFSDVVVVQPGTSITPERAFVFYGSGAGLNLSSQVGPNSSQCNLSWSATCAGDVNNDGFSDIIIGAPWYTNTLSNQGRVYVHYGSAAGIVSTPGWVVTGPQTDGRFGASASGAGDVNGDGVSDVIIGQPLYTNGQSNEGRALIYYGVSGSGLPASPSWSYEPNYAGANLGISASFAGDVNGDGFCDAIIGASTYSNGQTLEGAAYVFYGGTPNVAAAPAWIEESDLTDAHFGASVMGAGDINGDGYAEVIVGAPSYDGLTDEGRAAVYFGSALGLSATPGWTATGAQASAFFGASVSVAGDVNGDGFSDVLVGAYGYNDPSTDEGAVFAYYGSAAGLSTSTFSAEQSGAQDDAQLGFAVSGAGDVNGDGYSDVLMGAPLYDNGLADQGRVSAFYGSANGLPASASWTYSASVAGAHTGSSVSSAGDVSGDGYADIIIGADRYTNGQAAEGLAVIVYGNAAGLAASPVWLFEVNQANAHFGASVSSAGDVNGDGYSDVIVGAPLFDNDLVDEGRAYLFLGSNTGPNPVTPDRIVEGNQLNAQFGWCVANAGDMNADGYGDVLVGAPLFDNGQTDEGRAFLYYGAPTGMPATAAWTAEADQANAQFGTCLAFAGDVNSDGNDDMIIGAPLYDGGQTDEGRAYLYYGAAAGPPTTASWTAESNAANAHFGYAVSRAGDVDGDGYGDVIIGAPTQGNGRVSGYYGTPAGLPSTADWTVSGPGPLSGEQFGASVSMAGSIGGDGYSDVLVGSPSLDVQIVFTTFTDRGRVFAFYGNSGASNGRRTRQYHTNLTAPVQTSNGTFENACTWGIGQVARSAFGRRKVKLAWEVRTHGPAFSGSPITNSVAFTAQSPSWTDITVPAGIELKTVVSAAGGSFPKWRVRLRNNPSTMLDGQTFSRWFYGGMQDEQTASVKTDFPDCGLLPIELTSFTAACSGAAPLLQWTTASEHNNAYFTLERSFDATDWRTITEISGAGESQQATSYSFLDQQPSSGTLAYYRLSQTDDDGTTRAFPMIAVEPCAAGSNAGLQAYPVPTDGLLSIVLQDAGISGPATLECTDAQGRSISARPIDLDRRFTSATMDISSFPAGIYLLYVLVDGAPVATPVRIVRE